ncbi:MAG: DUF3820 family protein [Acidobacteriota bacterium]
MDRIEEEADERRVDGPGHAASDLAALDLGFGGDDLNLLVEWEMPFGRFAGRRLIDLPEDYLFWFERRGDFPAGRLGRLLRLCLGIKRHGAEQVVKALGERGANEAPRDSG